MVDLNKEGYQNIDQSTRTTFVIRYEIKIVVFSDTKSVLQALDSGKSNNVTIRELTITIDCLITRAFAETRAIALLHTRLEPGGGH